MPVGPITAVRIFQNLKVLLAYTSGQQNRVWFEEQFSSINAPELGTLVDTLDRLAAVDQTSRLRQEHTDAYCLQRDLYYGTRSRKWMYTRAMASRVENNYGPWLSFIRENMTLNLQNLVNTDPDILAVQTPEQLLNIATPNP